MQPALAIDQLSKTYEGNFQALKGISLTVQQGGLLCIARAQWCRQIHDYWYYLLSGIENQRFGEHFWL